MGGSARRRRRFTRAVERLADDPGFASRFRADPERAVRRYRLGPDQLAALKSGEAPALASAGLDVAAFARGKRHGVRPRAVRVIAAVSALVGMLGVSAAPATARRLSPRHGLRRAARRARLDLSGTGVRAGIGTAIRAGRLSPHGGIRVGLRESRLRVGLRAVGVRLGKDPCPELCEAPSGPFELGGQ